MVNIIENKAVIEADFISRERNGGPNGYDQILVLLKKSADVEGYPNLAAADEGKEIIINIRPRQFAKMDLRTGSAFRAKVRKVFGGKYFVDEEEENRPTEQEKV